jgi:hypothetical protein
VALSLTEFLAPLKRSTIVNRVLAIMYYETVYGQSAVFGSEDIRRLMVKVRDPKKNTNVAVALNQLGPKVEMIGDENGKNLWRITDSGKAHVRELLGLPDESVEAQNEVASLTTIAAKVADDVIRDYLLEGIECLRFNALRAAIVFLWSGTIRVIQEEVLKQPSPAINTSLQKQNPKARVLKTIEDFSYIKDSQVLQTARDLGIFDKAEQRVLGHCLDLRNDCGHPTKYVPKVNKVKSFVEDIIGIVYT